MKPQQPVRIVGAVGPLRRCVSLLRFARRSRFIAAGKFAFTASHFVKNVRCRALARRTLAHREKVSDPFTLRSDAQRDVAVNH
jgi:hypothetical protein